MNEPPDDKTAAHERTIMGGAEELPTSLTQNSPYLRIIHPRDLNRRYPLPSEGLTLGRGEDADVVLPDGLVSRIHCRVLPTEEGIVVEDLGSTNGTMIDGRAVTRAQLPAFGRLKVGPFVLKIEYTSEAEVRADERLFAAATTDALTGIPNRRWLMDQGLNFLASFRDAEQVISAVLLDVDHFKQVNDTWGHAAGDEVLKGVAGILAREKRELDLLGRYGGEEFLMFLPDASEDDALVVCERIRAAVERGAFQVDGTTVTVTISIGVCSLARGEVGSLEAMIRRADEALYAAKRAGRNRVHVAS